MNESLDVRVRRELVKMLQATAQPCEPVDNMGAGMSGGSVNPWLLYRREFGKDAKSGPEYEAWKLAKGFRPAIRSSQKKAEPATPPNTKPTEAAPENQMLKQPEPDTAKLGKASKVADDKEASGLYIMSPKGRWVLKDGPTGRRLLRAQAVLEGK